MTKNNETPTASEENKISKEFTKEEVKKANREIFLRLLRAHEQKKKS